MIRDDDGRDRTAVGGELHGDGGVVVTGPVEYDTRKVGPGGLFVAFAGERSTGMTSRAANAAGAVAVLGSGRSRAADDRRRPTR